jgi:hypothetical protein
MTLLQQLINADMDSNKRLVNMKLKQTHLKQQLSISQSISIITIKRNLALVKKQIHSELIKIRKYNEHIKWYECH